MSVQTLYSAATGMLAMEKKLDVISNNLANIETTAFKKDLVNFEDLFYRHEVFPGAEDSSGENTPIGISVGLGSRLSGIQTDFRQGAFSQGAFLWKSSPSPLESGRRLDYDKGWN